LVHYYQIKILVIEIKVVHWMYIIKLKINIRQQIDGMPNNTLKIKQKLKKIKTKNNKK